MKAIPKAFRKPKFIALVLFAVLALGAIYALAIKGQIFADTTVTRYLISGKLSYKNSSVGVPGANLSVISTSYQISSSRSCTTTRIAAIGSSATTFNNAWQSYDNGNFTLSNKLPVGCYKLRTTYYSNVTHANKITDIPIKVGSTDSYAMTDTATSNDGALTLTYLSDPLVVNVTPTPTPAPSRTTTATTYSVTGLVTDKDGAPIGSASIQNSSPQRNKFLVGSTTECDRAQQNVVSTAQATTDVNGHFTFQGLPTGCFTIKITKSVSPAVDTMVVFAIPTGGSTEKVSNQDGSVNLIAVSNLGPPPPAVYDTTAYFTDLYSNPISGIRVTNIAQTKISGGVCTTTVVPTTPASATTDYSGKFTLKNLPDGCYTWQFSRPCPAGQICPADSSTQVIIEVTKDVPVLGGLVKAAVSLGGLFGNHKISPKQPQPGEPNPLQNPGSESGSVTGKVTATNQATPPAAITDLTGILINIEATASVDGKNVVSGTYQKAVTAADGTFTTVSLPTKIKNKKGQLFDVTYTLSTNGSPTFTCKQYEGAKQTIAALGFGLSGMNDLVLGGCKQAPGGILYTGKITNGTTPMPGVSVEVKKTDPTNGTQLLIGSGTSGTDGIYAIGIPGLIPQGQVFGIHIPPFNNCQEKFVPTGSPDLNNRVITDVSLACTGPEVPH